MKKIYLFTTSFPYRNQETFLESEIKFLAIGFDKIYIYPFYKHQISELRRNLPTNVFIKTGFLDKSYFLRLLKIFYNPSFKILWLFIKDFSKYKVFSSKQRFFSWWAALVNTLNVNNSKSYKDIKSVNEGIFYFYWGVSFSNMLHFLPKKDSIKYVIRLHGGDIYLDRSNGYIPLRHGFFDIPNYFIPISNDIKKYLENIYKVSSQRINLQKLGSFYLGKNPSSFSKSICIVTCSNAIPLKRLSSLVECLRLINDINIIWNHFGDGPELERIKKESKNLSSNITTVFHGRIPNSEVLNFYKSNPVDIFVNLSLHEGIPVSIMEAMSFGIPCLATDVGATREIVNDTNGKLIDSNFSILEVCQIICNSKSEDWLKKREKAFEFWNQNYNAEINYNNLVSFFKNIISNNA